MFAREAREEFKAKKMVKSISRSKGQETWEGEVRSQRDWVRGWNPGQGLLLRQRPPLWRGIYSVLGHGNGL